MRIMNLEKAKQQFIKYTENYNLKEERVKAKQNHSLRVMRISKQIAERLKLSQEEIELATLIGLLHDIVRFEQYTKFKTYKDLESFDHGDYGAEILQKDIRKYIETNEFDQIMKVAILNHNRLEIEARLTEREYLHSQIIRDADKVDIYSILISDTKITIWGKDDLSKEKISDEIYRQFKEETSINYKNIKTPADLLVCHFKFVYDLNFKETKQIIKENKYLDKLYERFTFEDDETIKRYNEIYRLAKAELEK